MRYGWSLCVQQWKELASMIADLTWEKVLVVRDAARDVPCEAGVYMLCTLPPQRSFFDKDVGLFNALYVGRADNLHNRFKNYQKRQNISQDAIDALDKLLGDGGNFSFVFSVVPREKLRETEGCLIRCLGPSVNKRDEIKLRGKIGEPIRV